MSIKFDTAKLHQLEKVLSKCFADIKSGGYFVEDRFAIYATKKVQIQLVITNEEDDFCDEVLKSVAGVIKEAE